MYAEKYNICGNNDQIHIGLVVHLVRDTNLSPTTSTHILGGVLAIFGLDTEPPRREDAQADAIDKTSKNEETFSYCVLSHHG